MHGNLGCFRGFRKIIKLMEMVGRRTSMIFRKPRTNTKSPCTVGPMHRGQAHQFCRRDSGGCDSAPRGARGDATAGFAVERHSVGILAWTVPLIDSCAGGGGLRQARHAPAAPGVDEMITRAIPIHWRPSRGRI